MRHSHARTLAHSQTRIQKQTMRSWRHILIKYIYVEFILIFFLELNKLLLFYFLPLFVMVLLNSILHVNYDLWTRIDTHTSRIEIHFFSVSYEWRTNEAKMWKVEDEHMFMPERIERQKEYLASKCIRSTHKKGKWKKIPFFFVFVLTRMWVNFPNSEASLFISCVSLGSLLNSVCFSFVLR